LRKLKYAHKDCAHSVPALKKITIIHVCKGKEEKAGLGVVPEESTVTITKEGSRPSDDDFRPYYCNISKQGTKPSILSLIPDNKVSSHIFLNL